jgi:DNA-binding transcriptional ArsR family regulator
MKTNTEQLKKAASMIRALNPERLEILKFISDKGETNVRSIYAEMGKEQSVISLNLSILRKAGFVKYDKAGQNRIYSVNIEFLERFNLIISDLCK